MINPCKKQKELMTTLGFERYDEGNTFYVCWRLCISNFPARYITRTYTREFENPDINGKTLALEIFREGQSDIQNKMKALLGVQC